ncbi:phosphotransferase [Bradyrhizobium lablabi]|uniref:phosphotransferase n=1 Tax=Bradyrhizobium lablabi TaxID=722472 RepID=UPI001BA66914|nr:phosphotransferase [Bradyrhizobium lablabi]MBR0696583.1 phosphotransferase [Bradyrhizobium lablabi]
MSEHLAVSVRSEIEYLLVSQAHELLGLPADAEVQFSRLHPARNRQHRVREFLIASVQGAPRLISKRGTDPHDTKVRRETSVLAGLMQSRSEPGARLIAAGRDGFVAPYLCDIDLPELWPLLSEARKDQLLDTVVDCMADFHAQVLTTTLIEPSRSFASAAVAGAPLGPIHGDLGPWNVRCSNSADRVAFVDWEDFHFDGPQAFDVLNLLLTMSIVEFPDFRQRGFEWLYSTVFIEPTAASRILRRGLLRYAEARSTDPELILAHVPLFCRYMIDRIEEEQRSTGNFYYRYFEQTFKLSDVGSLFR